ncbi:MAG: flagellar hook-length control protein FliK [Burkholderiales bacterium]
MELRALGNLLKDRLLEKMSVEGSLASAPIPARMQSSPGARPSNDSQPDMTGRRGGHPPLPSDNIALSTTGQLIAKVLALEFTQSSAIPLTSLTPLVDEASEPPAIAARLAQIVSRSGLFYESHLADWAAGKRDLSQVKAESSQRMNHSVSGPVATTQMNDRREILDATTTIEQSGQDKSDSPSVAEPSEENAARTNSQMSSDTVPASEDRKSMQLVRQQLDVLATGQIAWQGLVREGVPGEIEIKHETRDGTMEQTDVWRARIRIKCPTLGDVDVAFSLAGKHLSLQVAARPDAKEHLMIAADAFALAVSSRGIVIGTLAIADPNSRGAS